MIDSHDDDDEIVATINGYDRTPIGIANLVKGDPITPGPDNNHNNKDKRMRKMRKMWIKEWSKVWQLDWYK